MFKWDWNEPSHASQIDACMLAIRVEGQPVGAEIDVGLESGFEAGNALEGAGWCFLGWAGSLVRSFHSFAGDLRNA